MVTDAGQQITVSLGDKTFTCSRRTAAHLQRTIDVLAKKYPKAHLHVIQGCYNKTVKASAGTHDFDACLDVRIDGMGWWDAQKFLRQQGWGAWYRCTGSWASPSQWHIHMISLPLGPWATTVGVYVPGQVIDYYNHTFGLKGQHNVDLDKSWFPGDGNKPNPPVGTYSTWSAAIRKTLFDYDAYLEGLDEMNDADWAKMSKMLDEKIAAAGDLIKVDMKDGKAPWSLATVLRTIRSKVGK